MSGNPSCSRRVKRTYFRGYGEIEGLDRLCSVGILMIGVPLLTGCFETFYADRDGDGYGNPDRVKRGVVAPEGYVDNGDDCDDQLASVHPGAAEPCNGVDDDCSGVVDDGEACEAGDCRLEIRDDHAYRFCMDRVDWEGALELCESYGLNLLSIADAEEEAWVYERLAEDPGLEWWTGFNDLDEEGSWTWQDGSPVTYVNWQRPNKRKDLVGKDCARLNRYEPDHGWYDSPCTVKARFVCEAGEGSVEEPEAWYPDTDGDGWGDASSYVLAVEQPSGHVAQDLAMDCDDADAAVHPGADERCNEVDDDCDGAVDEDAVDTATWYADADGDGHGDTSVAAIACEAPSGHVAAATDCDDADAAVHPGADERCNEVDDDCDGSVDEDAVDTATWYADADGDGYGDGARTRAACSCPTGFVADATDCDDAAATINPAGTELCDGADNDCDGTTDIDAVDAPTWYADADGDGYGDASTTATACEAPAGYLADARDCDDATATINPAGTELCDGADNDCDGTTDIDAVDAPTWYADADGDGYGDASTTATACEAPAGYLADARDCDDATATTNPASTELCDGADNDCDGTIDVDAVDALTWYVDADGDGNGHASATVTACECPAGYADNTDDCDDTVVSPPIGLEYCDGIDNDCDGAIDEDDAVDASRWWRDADDDGYGDPELSALSCYLIPQYVHNDLDCDDSEPIANPGAVELCDGIDNDCDGSVDDDPVDSLAWYADGDGDGYGDAGSLQHACEQPAGHVLAAGDCDDDSASVSPDASERCNGADDDCDGVVDEDAVDADSFYLDADGDGYGLADAVTLACSLPAGHASNDRDCDDAAPTVHPGADEHCNDADDDCDGSVDERAVDAPTWYRDADADGYGSSVSTTSACSLPSGYVADASDCDDGSAEAFPGGDELCDGLDNDCDGETDEDGALDAPLWYADADGDGYGTPAASVLACSAPAGHASADLGEDCDDSLDVVNPGALEACDTLDNDCDGSVDEDPGEGPLWYRDADGDGHGDPAVSTIACAAGDGWVAAGDDCDDSDASDWHGPAWYQDLDGDGYGDASTSVFACEAPAGWVADSGDCDDGDRAVRPGASESCNGVDDDCDGEADEAAMDATAWYADLDGDGFGDASRVEMACSVPAGHVSNDNDCDDAAPTVYPGADEHCDGLDEDCDGVVDELGAVDAPSWYRDGDGDGYGNAASTLEACSAPAGYVADATDCDDGAADTSPGASEACDAVDNDCDGAVDEDDARDALAWYLDLDGDGYGNPSGERWACEQPSGYVGNAEDCNDAALDVRPGVTEICDGQDNDCDGTIDGEDAVDPSAWYLDADADGHGLASTEAWACDAPEDHVATAGDCDDGDPEVSPAADELCDGIDNDCDGTADEDDALDAVAWYLDADADGYGAGDPRVACQAVSGEVEAIGDCDDADSTVHPSASEHCDGVDEDCDGEVDDHALDASTWYRDNDGDGYGQDSRTIQACEQPAGTSALHGDCEDGSAAAFPGATEICDGLDNDCDGAVDADAVDAATWYRDADGDGWGYYADSLVSCEAPSGYVAVSGDCDDATAGGPPGEEYCDGFDNDCDGEVDEPEAVDASWWYADRDHDGHGNAVETALACYQPYEFVLDATDCDDNDPARYPSSAEYCDGQDNDCDDEVDEDAIGRTTWYEDGDLDGFGDAAVSSFACEAPEGWVVDGSDCDDADPAINPAASEICNGGDDDCDGTVDEDAVDAATWYQDADGDGYGVPDVFSQACEPSAGWSGTADDCDDTTVAAWPGADELCDGLDNDCDGTTDEDDALDAVSWYLDADADGYGEIGTGTPACLQPSERVADGTDCDDGNADVNPGVSEICNGVDDDCDGNADEQALDATPWYRDADGDGHGDPELEEAACEQPEGWVVTALDCDDGDEAVSPDASELCNGVDDDCDGEVDDDALDGLTWYADADSDGYGADDMAAYACERPDGFVAEAGDCDDAVAVAYPGATELCDGLDNDCDGTSDEDDAVDATRWFVDEDGDGYGERSQSHRSCEAPTGYVPDRNDCNDADPWINPGVTELCDGIDNDCDDIVDLDSDEIVTQYLDADGDGWGARGAMTQACELLPGYVLQRGDCDDAAASTNPDAPELCDSLDNDCDTLVDEDDAADTRSWFKDRDRDGYGDALTTTSSCAQPDGYVSNDLDCDDRADSVNPDGIEVCKDGIDNDCDGALDDCAGWPEEVALATAEGVLLGESGSSKAGCALAALGDLDGDGLGELAVGAWLEDSVATNAGAVYLVDGPVVGETSLATATAKLTGEGAYDYVGTSLAAAGDVNGDGWADLVVGAKGHDAGGDSAGAAYLVLGPVEGELGLASADARLRGMGEDAYAGAAVASAGDVNGDGNDDLLVGAYGDDTASSNAGAAFLLLGPVSGTSDLASADARLLGAASKDYAGASVAGLGDVDGDGFDDVAVGAWGHDAGAVGAGAVHVVYGPVAGDIDLAQADVTLLGASRGDHMGTAVVAAGDLDGDGRADILVGAEDEDSGGDNAGAAYLFRGAPIDGTTADEADLILVGAGKDHRAGASLAVAGDLDGDGETDLVVGAPGASVNGSASGAAYLVFAADVGVVDLATDGLPVSGEASLDNAGLSVAGPGDMNGDGLDDLLVGAEGNDRAADQAGAVFLVAGMLAGQ